MRGLGWSAPQQPANLNWHTSIGWPTSPQRYRAAARVHAATRPEAYGVAGPAVADLCHRGRLSGCGYPARVRSARAVRVSGSAVSVLNAW